MPKGELRPTTDRAREALFSMLSQRVEGARVLDLFAGCGSLGLESLSRGAQSCDFVDAERASVRVISENLRDLSLEGGSVLQAQIPKGLDRLSREYDLIFADPPYWQADSMEDYAHQLLSSERLWKCLSEEGLLLLETSERYQIGEYAAWELLDRRQYGGCAFHIFEKGEQPPTGDAQ